MENVENNAPIQESTPSLSSLRDDLAKVKLELEELEINPEQDFEDLAEEIETTEDKVKDGLESIAEAESKLTEAEQEVDGLKDKVKDIDHEMSKLRSKYDNANERLNKIYLAVEKAIEQIDEFKKKYERRSEVIAFEKLWQKWFPGINLTIISDDEIWNYIQVNPDLETAVISMRRDSLKYE